ncbi:dihydrofolate reductase [Motilibacter peucedani]|uniref:Dihydrofolate reductase n=1 Tax=Motilibacter peucedani TaxID=598650 RepID=A0A420XR84_9ACTN|nr:dihydrofolate reductase family protein [Motilibacter peucedani]RKS75722.1 dihydrofolate reductase [Motilibacter peucedani]
MADVVMHAVVSVDGYVADPDDEVGPLFDWYFNGDTEIVDGGPFKVSPESAAYVRPMWQSIGATVMGRHLFDLTNGWEGKPPAGDHVVVVSHRPKPDGWHPEASYDFVDDVAAGVARAKERAGDRVVALTAGDVGGQALALGLVDEVAMDVVPVVFGAGKRYFGAAGDSVVLEDPHVVVQGDRVLHLRYRVRH